MNKFITYFLSILCLLQLSETSLTAATIFVGAPPASIQTAINSATSGDTIQLSAGTYIEEIQIISKSLDIVGFGVGTTMIQAPNSSTRLTQNFNFGANFWCVVMVDNQAAPSAQIVNIQDLTIDGSNQQDTTIPPIYGSSDRFFAIGYHNAGGTIQNVHTTNTKQTANFNELAGGGIVNASNNGNVIFNVTNCLIDFYQRQGIDCRGSTLTANISNSTINRGYVLTPNATTATPNGIQYSGLATGSITDNTVEGNIATVFNASATGLIPFGAGPDLLISGNTLNNNDIAIAAIQCGNNLNISQNTVNFTTTQGVNTTEGILVQDTSGLTTLTANIMNNIPNVNMDIISSTDQAFNLSGNQFIGSNTGLLITGNSTTGPIVTMDGDTFSGSLNYYIQEVSSPNDIWPSTSSVTFDGLISGSISLTEYDQILNKIYGDQNDPTLGVVLDYIPPQAPELTSISPDSGTQAGGNTVTINGSHFISSDTKVYFGTTLATSTVISDTVIEAIAPAGTGIVDISVETSFGITPEVVEDEYTYVGSLTPLPPTCFKGIIKQIGILHYAEYYLKATWKPSPSPDVVAYRIYKKRHLLEEINASSNFVYRTKLQHEKEAKKYYIVAVNSSNVESTPVFIKIED
jgi:hypothetical protein